MTQRMGRDKGINLIVIVGENEDFCFDRSRLHESLNESRVDRSTTRGDEEMAARLGLNKELPANTADASPYFI